jgi:hypothetical protein
MISKADMALLAYAPDPLLVESIKKVLDQLGAAMQVQVIVAIE